MHSIASCFARRRGSRLLALAALATVISVAGTTRPLHAAWHYQGNAAYAGATGVEVTEGSVHTISDGAGGTYTCWSDDRNGDFDVFIQRLDDDGAVVSGWPTSGFNVQPLVGDQTDPRIALDGAGGVYVVYESPHSNTGRDVYITRVTSSAAVASGWCELGVRLTEASGDQVDPNVARDGDGGALVTFHDSSKIYAARVASTGSITWSTSDATSAGAPTLPSVVDDGDNGAIVVYRASGRLFGQRYRGSDGAGQWSGSTSYPDVLTIVDSGSVNEDASIATDEIGGVLVAYAESNDISLQRVTTGGTVWSSAITVCSATGTQSKPQVVSDAAMGAIVSWVDDRSAPTTAVYVQRVRSGTTYTTCWTANGVAVVSSVLADPTLSMDADGVGGAYMAWSTNDVSVRHIDSHGDLGTLWGLSPVSGSVQKHTSIAVTTDTTAVVSWWDDRSSKEGVYLNEGSFSAPAIPDGLTDLTIDDTGKNTHLLGWDDPSDDPTHGAASTYILRRSTSAITEANFDNATLLAEVSASGGPYCYTVSGLSSCTTYYYAIRTRFGCQVSDISNVPSGATNCSGTDVLCGGFGARQAPPDLEGAMPQDLELNAVGSNPTSRVAALQFGVPQTSHGQHAKLTIYDVAGRRLRTVFDGTVPAGVHKAQWDLRDDAGRLLGGGVYFARLRLGGQTLTRTVVVQP